MFGSIDQRGPASRGIAVDAEGAMLGPDCVLVRRTAAGYRCLRREEAAVVQKFLFAGEDTNPDRLFALCRGIAGALNDGEVALAQIYGLRVPITPLDPRQLRRVAAAAAFIRANFNPDEPRDDHGRWTDEDGGASETPAPSHAAPTGAVLPNSAAYPRGSTSAAVPLVVPVGATAAADAGTSIFGALGRTALAGLVDVAADIAAPTAFLGVLFLPTNRSLLSQGALPGRPDLGYRYDQDTGVLEICRQIGPGRQLLVTGHIGTDGLFHDADGRVIGRGLGSSIAVDPNALPAPIGRTDATADAASASPEKKPQLCPDPSAEPTAGRSARSLAYQQQITGLPPGLEVKLNGVRFDGCRETDGTMLEAKGPGYDDKMTGPQTWWRWYTGVQPIKTQMRNQSTAAIGRTVEWHFAEPNAAQYFKKYGEDEGLGNINVIYTPAK